MIEENWLLLAQHTLAGAVLLLSLLGIGLAVTMPGMDRWNRHFFMTFFTTLALNMAGVFAEIVSYGNPDMLPILSVGGFVDSLLPSVLMVMPLVYLLHSCGQSLRTSRLLHVVLAVWVFYVVMLICAQFTDAFYYLTPESVFAAGPLYPLLILPLITNSTLILAGVIRRRRSLSRRLFVNFITIFGTFTVALLIHLTIGSFLLINVSLTISSISMFLIAVSEQIDHHIRLQEETARQRASIAVLQMRPHFIHNTMTSIYYLCDQDPKCAQQLTMDFNTYLRKNFTAIAQEGRIPVTEELEHTRAYLAVEQAQFQSKLKIHYDTSYTRFSVPPLTLQPLAENAVKHCMSPQTVPLHVSIRTRRIESASVVIVEDNGPGFDASVSERPHTTLHNIRQRLEMMCGGTLEIEPREGGGTVVRVTIPDDIATRPRLRYPLAENLR